MPTSTVQTNYRHYCALAAVATLMACGGGGGGSEGGSYNSSDSGYGSTNSAPTWSASSEAVQIPENSTDVPLAATASDADGQSLTYSLEGEDAERFTLTSTGDLSFTSAPDFEAAQDVGTDNVYTVAIVASDGAASASLSVSVTVTDVDENSGQTGGTVSGKVVSGTYLSQASVFQDIDGNGLKADDEPGALTDANGQFAFDVDDYLSGPILSLGGVDPSSGSSYGAAYLLNGGIPSSDPLIISPIGSLLISSAEEGDTLASGVIQALDITESAATRDPLTALSDNASGAERVALNNAQLSVLTASLSAITGLSTTSIEAAIAVRGAATSTRLVFSSVQLLADVASDLNDPVLNTFITEITGSVGRFLQQMSAADVATLGQFVDVGLRAVVADSVAIAGGDTTLAEDYRTDVLGVVETNSSLANLSSQLPNFNEYSYRISEGAASGFQYTIDGADATATDIIVYARVGDTIRFDDVVALTSHPFRLGRSPESSPLSEADGVIIDNNHHVALVVNENTPTTIYPYCQVHSNMFDRGRIEIVDTFEGLQFPGLADTPLQVRGVVDAGKYDGAAGYTYDVYLTQEAAENASSQTIHQHRMEDMPSIPFFMPDGQGYHGAVEPAASAEFKPISVQD